MVALIARIDVKPGHAARFEEILADMVAQTKAREPDCLRYEYWRGAAENFYYCLLAFRSKIAFYEHQNSDYHEGYLDEFAACFAGLTLEYIDPADQKSGFPRTEDSKLPDDPALRAAEEKYPITVPTWWGHRR